MGRAYIYWNELPRDLKCPKCGSRVFRVSGAYKEEYESVIHIDSKGHIIEDEIDTLGEEWRVVDGIICAKCEADLFSLVGL